MSTSRRRRLVIGPVMGVAMLGLLIPATAVLATGTCTGSKLEYTLPDAQQIVDPRVIYDKNLDGIICISVTGRFNNKEQYSDNKVVDQIKVP